eukprot:jgi/Ulvmu1/10084/UM006_0031.1
MCACWVNIPHPASSNFASLDMCIGSTVHQAALLESRRCRLKPVQRRGKANEVCEHRQRSVAALVPAVATAFSDSAQPSNIHFQSAKHMHGCHACPWLTAAAAAGSSMQRT